MRSSERFLQNRLRSLSSEAPKKDVQRSLMPSRKWSQGFFSAIVTSESLRERARKKMEEKESKMISNRLRGGAMINIFLLTLFNSLRWGARIICDAGWDHLRCRVWSTVTQGGITCYAAASLRNHLKCGEKRFPPDSEIRSGGRKKLAAVKEELEDICAEDHSIGTEKFAEILRSPVEKKKKKKKMCKKMRILFYYFVFIFIFGQLWQP